MDVPTPTTQSENKSNEPPIVHLNSNSNTDFYDEVVDLTNTSDSESGEDISDEANVNENTEMYEEIQGEELEIGDYILDHMWEKPQVVTNIDRLNRKYEYFDPRTRDSGVCTYTSTESFLRYATHSKYV